MKKTLFTIFLASAIWSNAFAADISHEYKYQVIVKENVGGIEYRDAIYYTPEEWETLTQAEVDAEIDKRVTNFDNMIKNPPAPVEPTKEDLEAYRVELAAQLADLDTKIAVAKPRGGKLESIVE